MDDTEVLSPIADLRIQQNVGVDNEENRSRSSADVSSDANPADGGHSNGIDNKHRRNRRKRMDAASRSTHQQQLTPFQSDVANDDTSAGRSPTTLQDGSVPGPSETSQRPRRKKKKIRVPDTIDETQTFPMDSIQQDILLLKQNMISVPDDPKVLEDLVAKRQVWHTNVQSQPSDKVFIERQGGFKAMEKWKLAQKLAANLSRLRGDGNNMTMASKSAFASSRALRLGLSLHCYTKRLANYCHGILAGFALCQCVMVYHLSSSPFTMSDFIQHYSSMAFPVQAFFYALLAICIVSMMGRCDEVNNSGGGGGSRWFQQIRNNVAGFVALLTYLATVLLSLSIVPLDDKLALNGRNSTAVLIKDDEMQLWMNVNLCRCLGALFAWLLLAVSADQDLLYDNVKSLIEKEEAEEEERN